MAVAKAYLPPVPEEKSKKFIEGLNNSAMDWDYVEKRRQENRTKKRGIKIKINVKVF